MFLDPIILSLIFLEAELWEKIEWLNVYFENDILQVVHPNMVKVASIFHSEGDLRNKTK